MKKLIIGIILVLLLASQVQARTVMEKEVVASEYGWLGEQLGFGDRLFKITYDDYTVKYILAQSSFLQPAAITYLKETVNVNVGVNPPDVPFRVVGDVSPAMGGSDTLHYQYQLYKGSCTSGELRQTFEQWIYYQTEVDFRISGAPFTSAGVYDYCLQEYIEMVSVSPPVWAKGNSKLLRVTVTDSAPNPTQAGTATATATSTPPPSQGKGYIKVTSNVPANVDIDNRAVGATGSTYTVDVGGHDVKVSLGGYTTYTTHVTAEYDVTTTVDAYLREATPQQTTPPPTSTTPGGTVASTSAGTPTPMGTSSVDVTYGAGGTGITYRNVDIRYEDGAYYVGDIPHDTLAEAKKTIDEMIAEKEKAKSPGFEAVFAIAGLVAVAYLVLRKKP